MTIFEFIVLIFAFSFAILIMVGQTRLVYRRYLKSYKQEIESYLKKLGFTLEVTYSPNKNDWFNSPFVKPPTFKTSFLVVSINNMPITWSDKKYKIVQTSEGKKIWLEIETTYFKKPIFTFKFSKKEKMNKSHSIHK